MIGRLHQVLHDIYISIKYRREWRQWKQENMSDWARNNGLVSSMAWIEFKDRHPEIDFSLNDVEAMQQ